jgi:hypothetical protein
VKSGTTVDDIYTSTFYIKKLFCESSVRKIETLKTSRFHQICLKETDSVLNKFLKEINRLKINVTVINT